MTSPLVSVVMSVFNSEKTLKRAIDSILTQSLKDFEFIIIDDCSTDGSLLILKEFEKQDCRIKIYQNEKNLGLATSLNKGLKLCSSDMVARMDADDYSYPDRLEKQYNFMMANSTIDILGSGVVLVDEKGKKYKEYLYPSCDDEIKQSLQTTCPLAHPTIMYKKNLILSVGGYDESLRRAQDFDLWKRLKEKAIFANLSESLLEYTIPLKRPFKTVWLDFKVSLTEDKFAIHPWVHLIKNLLVFFGIYTPKSLRKK